MIVHPQTWPKDLDYHDKEVIVIGSGATAATLVPAIADDVQHVTILQRSPALPVALAVWTTTVGLVAVVAVVVRVLVLPGAASERCYGLWLALAGTIGVLVAGWLSVRDERPFWGVPASGTSPR